MKKLLDFIIKNIFPLKPRIVMTSGTTGKRKKFLASSKEAFYFVYIFFASLLKYKISITGKKVSFVIFTETSSYRRTQLTLKLARIFEKVLNAKLQVIPANPPELLFRNIPKILDGDILISTVLSYAKILDTIKSIGDSSISFNNAYMQLETIKAIKTLLQTGDLGLDAVLLYSSYPPRNMIDDTIKAFGKKIKILSYFGMAETGPTSVRMLNPELERCYNLIHPAVKYKAGILDSDNNKIVLYPLSDRYIGITGKLYLDYSSIYYSLRNYETGDIIKICGRRKFTWLGRTNYRKDFKPQGLPRDWIPTPSIRFYDIEFFESELLSKLPFRFYLLLDQNNEEIIFYIDPMYSGKITEDAIISLFKEAEYDIFKRVKIRLEKADKKILMDIFSNPYNNKYPVIYYKI